MRIQGDFIGFECHAPSNHPGVIHSNKENPSKMTTRSPKIIANQMIVLIFDLSFDFMTTPLICGLGLLWFAVTDLIQERYYIIRTISRYARYGPDSQNL